MTRLGYDRAGCLTFSQDPRYGIRRLSYDAARQLIAATNGIGGATRYAYDDRGRLVSITDPLGAVTTRTYTDLDQVAAQTDPLGRVTTAAYDAAGRQIAQTAPDGVTTEWTYDAAGLASGLSVDGRRVTEIRRDPRTRLALRTPHCTHRASHLWPGTAHTARSVGGSCERRGVRCSPRGSWRDGRDLRCSLADESADSKSRRVRCGNRTLDGWPSHSVRRGQRTRLVSGHAGPDS
ncbi:Rhs family protein [Microbacterium testaceum StLB037]|uniref:Rhs family protein n=1 Tax=Microbacterium testaceum (strain StLB037) TaxID=979556 RepID=E8NAF4_MICTS|nr:Rhs family protein [Microbacterium testaceum StLB037]